jgi:ABC-type uncharacterized transport system substrate-binding protein
MASYIRRRKFLATLGGAGIAWPLAAHAQQPAMPVIGYLDPRSPDGMTERLRGFRQGLKDSGFVEGENVAILYRWAEGQYASLPELAAELVRRQVAVITATGGVPSSLAAKAATTTIPIVFIAQEDPVRLGLVASLARPGGNLTGVNFFNYELTAKRKGGNARRVSPPVGVEKLSRISHRFSTKPNPNVRIRINRTVSMLMYGPP